MRYVSYVGKVRMSLGTTCRSRCRHSETCTIFASSIKERHKHAKDTTSLFGSRDCTSYAQIEDIMDRLLSTCAFRVLDLYFSMSQSTMPLLSMTLHCHQSNSGVVMITFTTNCFWYGQQTFASLSTQAVSCSRDRRSSMPRQCTIHSMLLC